MDKNRLIKSTSKRDLVEIHDNYESDFSLAERPKNEIRMGDSTITLSPQDVTRVVEGFVRTIDGIVNIIEIREQGKQAVRIIEAEIKKIQEEAAAEIEKMQNTQKNWNEKFDRKSAMFFAIIDKLEKNTTFDSETKQAILNGLKVLLYENQ